MSNDNNELKNNELCEEKQEARELTPDELAKVNGGGGFITGLKPGQGGLETMGATSLAAVASLAMCLEKIPEVR